jgi:ubiquinone/menaquinone biosynthesis C-methylase UbiE
MGVRAFFRKCVKLVRPTFLKFLPLVDLHNYEPYKGHADSYCLPIRGNDFDGTCPQGLPIPPERLRYGYRTKERFLQTGKEDVDSMLSICPLEENTKRILDFGCGTGRMIRWFNEYASGREVWGTDIVGNHLLWCQNHLNPPFHFVLTTTLPHLPFEDRYFDMIYAGSVFTHIDDLATAWLLELRRVLSENGKIYITLHDENTLMMLAEQYRDHNSAKKFRANKAFREYSNTDFGMFTFGRRANSQVFYNTELFRRIVDSVNLTIVSVTPGTYRYQTGIIVKKKGELS